MTFYERLTELRREKGLTQKQIVDELNLGKNSFGDWKKGTIPVRSTQQLLAKYFGVSVDYLMGKTNNPIPNTETVGTYIPYEKRGSASSHRFSFGRNRCDCGRNDCRLGSS